jgi:hypothetical protein
MKNLKTTDFLKGKSDSGAALALVLLLVVFLSLWLAAVTIFNSNSKDAAAHTIAKSQERQTNVNAAVDAALAAINAPGSASYVPSAGDLTNAAGGNACPSKLLSPLTANTPVYTDANGTKVYCVLASDSSVVALPAGLVLTGSTTNSTGTNVGTDLGLNIVSSSGTCDPTKGLIINSSIITAASYVTSNNPCPIQQGQTTTSTSNSTAGNNSFVVPSTAPTLPPISQPVTGTSTKNYMKGSGLDSHTPGSEAYYRDRYITSTLPGAPLAGKDASKATFEGTCTSPVSFTPAGSSTVHKGVFVEASSNKSATNKLGQQFDFGWIDDTALATLNKMTDGSSTSCGYKGVPIYFTHSGNVAGKTGVEIGNAVFRFERTSATSQNTEWLIKGHAEISAGHPSFSSGDHLAKCDNSHPGDMLEFGIGATITLDEAKFFACNLNTTSEDGSYQYPACAAPERGYGADFYYSSVDTNGTRRTNSRGRSSVINVEQPVASDESDAKTNTSSASYIASHANGSDDSGAWSTWTSTEKLAFVKKYGSKLNIAGSNDTERLATVEANKNGEQRRAEGTHKGSEDEHVSEGLNDFSVSGSCFLPGASTYFYQSSQSHEFFSQGLETRALTLNVGDKGSSLTNYSPAAATVGDRKILMHVVNRSGVLVSTMAVAINDNYGYRGKSGDGYTIVGQTKYTN